MTRKNHLCQGLLCIGLAVAISSPSMAGWGSFGGGSYGSGGSGGSSHGSSWGGGSYGSGGSTGGSLFSHRANGSSGGSLGGLFGGLHSSRGSHGSTGGSVVVLKAHGSSGGGSVGGSLGHASHGSSGGSSGGLFHGGLISKLRSMHQNKMSWLRSRSHGSSGGSSGGSSHGSSGGGHVLSYGSGGSSHGSHGSSHGGSLGSYSYSSSVATSAVASADVTPMMAAPSYVDGLVSSSAVYSESMDVASSNAIATSENGSLQVSLPEQAKLFVNGQETTSTGTSRQFVSKGLKSGYRYPYTVKAVMDVNGREVVRTKTVEMRAGDTLDLAFDFSDAATTKLTVRVPEGASVELAGAKTKASGAERQFATTKLAQGQLWEGYDVVVTVNGMTKTQTIDLRGGEHRTLTFDFDSQDVAQR